VDDRGYTGVGGALEGVWEREKPVRGHDRSLRPITRFATRQVDRILATRLP
jgi:hypothetical protein